IAQNDFTKWNAGLRLQARAITGAVPGLFSIYWTHLFIGLSIWACVWRKQGKVAIATQEARRDYLLTMPGQGGKLPF
ncbi:MAG: hypothetical protein MUP44_11335, partial [Anaerolineales bacterium]|nr:hypothetical protein [Anaerolineales bacterium]